MKGSYTLVETPFRYGGTFIKHYEWDVEEWANNPFKKNHYDKCYCCGGKMRNAYSSDGTLLHRNYPYCAVFKTTKGKNKGKCHFKILCRKCAYEYGKGVIELDGEVYQEYNQFNEEQYKKVNHNVVVRK